MSTSRRMKPTERPKGPSARAAEDAAVCEQAARRDAASGTLSGLAMPSEPPEVSPRKSVSWSSIGNNVESGEASTCFTGRVKARTQSRLPTAVRQHASHGLLVARNKNRRQDIACPNAQSSRAWNRGAPAKSEARCLWWGRAPAAAGCAPTSALRLHAPTTSSPSPCAFGSSYTVPRLGLG
jgi:hypothetical protein